VRNPLNKNIISKKVSTRTTIQNIIVVSFVRKLFTSLRLIHKFAKNVTSLGVFALKITNVKNAAPNIRDINNIAHKNENAAQAENDFFCFF
jgi:hypothetical protein